MPRTLATLGTLSQCLGSSWELLSANGHPSVLILPFTHFSDVEQASSPPAGSSSTVDEVPSTRVGLLIFISLTVKLTRTADTL